MRGVRDRLERLGVWARLYLLWTLRRHFKGAREPVCNRAAHRLSPRPPNIVLALRRQDQPRRVSYQGRPNQVLDSFGADDLAAFCIKAIRVAVVLTEEDLAVSEPSERGESALPKSRPVDSAGRLTRWRRGTGRR